MPFDWREYVELAKDLAGQAKAAYSTEAAQRSAVSRAYYGAFCFARNYAQTHLGFQDTGKAEDHIKLREHLTRNGRAKLASALNKLRGWRNDCDYEDEVPNIGRLVQSAIRLAEQVIQQCGP